MGMTALDMIKLAVTATRHGPGPKRMSDQVRAKGVDAFTRVYDDLDETRRNQVDFEATELEKSGVSALLMGEDKYPLRLLAMSGSPAALFCRGNLDLVDNLSVGICGSRAASIVGLRAANVCGEVAASLGMTAISGYAKGVDTAAHVASLRAGGSTIVVLPEGITHFRVKRGDIANEWDDDRTLVVSQFSPTQPWRASAAMTRNSTIIGLSAALVVVEAGETGGTLAAGMTGLDVGRRVLALEFSGVPRGNQLLLRKGAIAVESRAELAEFLDHLRSDEDYVSSDRGEPVLPFDVGH